MDLHKTLYNITHDGLDQKIEDIKWQMSQTDDPHEIMDLSVRLNKLIDVRNNERKNKIGAKEIFSAGVSLAGLVAVIFHEETSVIASKSGQWIGKLFK